MKRTAAKETRVVPVILRSCGWQEAPLSALSPLPAGGKPVKEWSSVDAALNDVVAGIKGIVEELRAAPAIAPP